MNKELGQYKIVTRHLMIVVPFTAFKAILW